MDTFQVDILNPKAIRLLKDLADLKLITLKKTKPANLLSVISALRKKADGGAPSLEEITEEVEQVRSENHASQKH